jgi:hypothetical protein
MLKWGKTEKLIAKPTLKRATIFTESLVATHLKRTRIELNKPVYIGMNILDI